jgi:hypothetical protein
MYVRYVRTYGHTYHWYVRPSTMVRTYTTHVVLSAMRALFQSESCDITYPYYHGSTMVRTYVRNTRGSQLVSAIPFPIRKL